MNSYRYPCDAEAVSCGEEIRSRAKALGAVACGFARAEAVDDTATVIYDRWVDAGHCGTMDYCRNHRAVRRDPRMLLDGARTVISCAFSYYNPETAMPMGECIARYAWGADYHYVLKQRLKQLGDFIKDRYGGEVRACVDTAPIRERYWAQRTGIGFVGVNNQLIVPGVGSYVFLGELLWTGQLLPDKPMERTCDGCMRCVKACPGAALDGYGGCDARRCVSYLTIEHKDKVAHSDSEDVHSDATPENTGSIAFGSLDGNGSLSADEACRIIHKSGMIYGCDHCQSVCPYNIAPAPTAISEFAPDSAILSLTAADIDTMTTSHFRRLTRHSAMSRITLSRMRQNLEAL